VLIEASRGTTPSETTPVVLADAGVENVNAQVDELIATGVLRRLLAFTELKFSNSMIEAWWRSLKHQWLFLHSLDSVATVRRLVEFYVQEHNRVLPHSAFRGQTPDEMYFGIGDAVPTDLTARAAAARRGRAEANRSAACGALPINRRRRMSTDSRHRDSGTMVRERLLGTRGSRGCLRNRAAPCSGSAPLSRCRAWRPE
jgi:hypothetical protein